MNDILNMDQTPLPFVIDNGKGMLRREALRYGVLPMVQVSPKGNAQFK